MSCNKRELQLLLSLLIELFEKKKMNFEECYNRGQNKMEQQTPIPPKSKMKPRELAFPQKRSRLCKDIASKQAGMLFNNTSCTNKKLFHLTIFFYR